jgi:hypothetical protein
MSDISKELFELMRSQFSSIELADENAELTTDPESAEFITMDYELGGTDHQVTLSLTDPKALSVYFPAVLVQGARGIELKKFHEFLKQIRNFAQKSLLTFNVYDIPKPQLDLDDLKTNKELTAPQESVSEGISRLAGSTKTSLQKLGEYTLKIRHSKPVTETGRFRNIKRLYIENRMGERFMLPTNNLAAGRAMLRHYCEGGSMGDTIGQHIVEMANTIDAGKQFLKRVIETNQINETTEEIVNIVKEYVLETNMMMKRLISEKTYKYFKENFKENRKFDTNTRWLESMFTQSNIDDQLGQVLPEINKIIFYNEA